MHTALFSPSSIGNVRFVTCFVRCATNFPRLFLVIEDSKVAHACHNVVRHGIALVLAGKMTLIRDTLSDISSLFDDQIRAPLPVMTSSVAMLELIPKRMSVSRLSPIMIVRVGSKWCLRKESVRTTFQIAPYIRCHDGIHHVLVRLANDCWSLLRRVPQWGGHGSGSYDM